MRQVLAAPAAFAAFLLCGCGGGIRSTSVPSGSVSSLTVSSAPKLGYAWSQTDRTLRPILGIPGSARLGDSITPAGTYEFGAVDPTGSYAILLGEEQSSYRMSLPGGSPVLLSEKAASGSRIVFSPQGQFAFLFNPGGTSGEILNNSASSAQTRSATYAGQILDAAISDAGSVATTQTSAGNLTIQVTPTTGQAVTIAAGLKGSGGVAFIAGTEDLLVGDSVANSLLRVHAASTSPGVTVIATSGLLKTPTSIGTSRTAHWAVIANSAAKSVVRIDLSGSVAAQQSECSCQPSTVAQLTTDGSFRLTSLQDGPVWIGDASRSSFPILFVPGQGKVAPQ